MQVNPNATDAPRPGRKLVISGIVVMVIAVLGVGVATAIMAGSIKLDQYDRDIVFSGPTDSHVPGRIHFKVIEDISSGSDDDMTVGVAASASSAGFKCQISDSSGAEVEERPGSIDDSFISGDIDPDWKPVVIAEALPPGEYSAECSETGEPTDGSAPGGDAGGGDSSGDAGSAPSFTAGRVVTLNEMFDTAKPVFALLAVVGVGGLVGLTGLILLIVGLVIGHRSRQTPPYPPSRMGPPYHPGPSQRQGPDNQQWPSGPGGG